MKSTADRPGDSGHKRILLVDDHPLMREGIALWIERATGFEVCGQASSSREAFASGEKLKPNLVLTDLSLVDGNGLELIKDLQALDPNLAILVVSMHEEMHYAERAIRAGARGYVMKEAGGEKVIEAIQTVLNGNVYVSSKLAASLVENLSARKPRGSSGKFGVLSDREFEVFELIGQGMNTHDIARRLQLSPKTVDVHRRNIRGKLRIPDVPGLIREAVRWTEAKEGGRDGDSVSEKPRSAPKAKRPRSGGKK
jgi:DNA-binding NarL/FixJ family response regulator